MSKRKIFYIGDAELPTYAGYCSRGILREQAETQAGGAEGVELYAWTVGSSPASVLASKGFTRFPAPSAAHPLSEVWLDLLMEAVGVVKPDLVVVCTNPYALGASGLAERLNDAGVASRAWLLADGGCPFEGSTDGLQGFDSLLATSENGALMLANDAVMPPMWVLEPGIRVSRAKVPGGQVGAGLLCLEPGGLAGRGDMVMARVAAAQGQSIRFAVPSALTLELESHGWGGGRVSNGDGFGNADWQLADEALELVPSAIISLPRSAPFSVGKLVAGAKGIPFFGIDQVNQEAMVEGDPLPGLKFPCFDFVADRVGDACERVREPADWSEVCDVLFAEVGL